MPISSKEIAIWKSGKGFLSASGTTLPLSNSKSTFGPKNGLKKLDFCASLISENNTAGPESPAVKLV